MRALRDGARTQGDRKGSPLLETAWQADPPVYSRGWACPCPAALHSFFHSPATSFMVARWGVIAFPPQVSTGTRTRATIKAHPSPHSTEVDRLFVRLMPIGRW